MFSPIVTCWKLHEELSLCGDDKTDENHSVWCNFFPLPEITIHADMKYFKSYYKQMQINEKIERLL